MRIGLLALLACLLVLPASAQASELRVTVVIHGPGKVTGNNFADCVSTVGNSASKICGTFTVGQADTESSTFAALTATANATQPNKSSFVKWTCITGSNAGCGGCSTTAFCQMTSALEKGTEDVIASVEFSDTTPPGAPIVTPAVSETVDRQVSFGLAEHRHDRQIALLARRRGVHRPARPGTRTSCRPATTPSRRRWWTRPT